MWTPLLRRLRPASCRKPPRSTAAPRRAFVPRLDRLEDRTVPSFADPTAIPFMWGGSLVRVADFNNDSRPDLLTANGPNLNVAVNDSAGIYAQTFHASLPAAIKDVAVGRINGDAYPDIVVATGETTIYLFLGSGATGGLSAAFSAASIKVTLPKGPNSPTQLAQNLALGDLTGDGKADIVVGAESGTYKGSFSSYRRDSLATVLIGRGGGTFRAGSSVVLDVRVVDGSTDPVPLPVPVAIGDVNADGKGDVVAASFGLYGYAACVGCSPPDELQGDYHVHLLTGDGQGKLQKNGALWSIGFQDGGWGLPSLAVRDLNGDGRDDILAAYSGSGLHISVSDPGTGKLVTTVYGVSAQPDAVAVGDVTGDGKLDVVLSSNAGGGIAVRAGGGDGTFGASQSFAADYAFAAMAVADLDGDGDLDLVLLGGPSVYQMLNDGAW